MISYEEELEKRGYKIVGRSMGYWECKPFVVVGDKEIPLCETKICFDHSMTLVRRKKEDIEEEIREAGGF